MIVSASRSSSRAIVALAIIGLLITAACSPQSTAQKETPESAAKLYLRYAETTLPRFNPSTEFVLTERALPGLWNAVGAQAFTVDERLRGQLIRREPVLCVAGRILPLGQSSGGVGVMSAVVAGKAFYFTYSFGSGIHRSHVARLIVVDGEPRLHVSPGFVSVDLFVEKSGDTARVYRGSYHAFNEWTAGTELGQVIAAEKERLVIRAVDGTEVTPQRYPGRIPDPTPYPIPKTSAR